MTINLRKLAYVSEPPFLHRHRATWSLLSLKAIYEVEDSRQELFLAAMRENTTWHFGRNQAYRRFCESFEFNPERDLNILKDLERLPALWVELSKEFDLATLHGPELMVVSSSGTSGRKTKITLDAETVIRMWVMGRTCFEEEGLVSKESVGYVVFAPDPAYTAELGNSHFFSLLTEFAPAQEIVYALVPDGERRLRLEVAKVIEALRYFLTSGKSVRLIGLPMLMATAARNTPRGEVRLDRESLVLTGGGWKGEGDQPLPKDTFRELLKDAWGIPPERIRDLYGMTEHAVHYLECSEHRFHPPVFSQVRIVDPLTRQPLPEGALGVLHLINPGFTTMPFGSILTADVGRMVGTCPCKRRTPAFEVLGRGGNAPHTGCAAATFGRLNA
jgi:hypothetical protein